MIVAHGDRCHAPYLHLSVAQRQEFLDLYLAKTMKVGYPGHFYRLPFFMRRAGEPG